MAVEDLEVKERIRSLGLVLPDPPKPSGHYLGSRRSGQFLFISGVTCKLNGEVQYKGRVGIDLSIEEGYEAARITTLNHLAIIHEKIGDFNLVDHIVKLTGYVNCGEGFADLPSVINGSSDLLTEVFGEKGMHARCAVGVNALPGNAAVETDLLVALK